MKITFNMATIPSRLKYALKTIETVYNQADEVRIYLNNFDKIPEELKKEKITTHIGKDLISSGKLFWATTPNEYYFCIDDDILYPPSYAKDMIHSLNQLDDKAAVSLHGSILHPTPIKSYFKGRLRKFQCLQGFPESTIAHIIGNGVSAWNTNKVIIDYTKFKYLHMDDIEVSLQLQQQKIPAVLIAHDKKYLGYQWEIEKDPKVTTLYNQYADKDQTQTERVNTIKWELNYPLAKNKL